MELSSFDLHGLLRKAHQLGVDASGVVSSKDNEKKLLHSCSPRDHLPHTDAHCQIRVGQLMKARNTIPEEENDDTTMMSAFDRVFLTIMYMYRNTHCNGTNTSALDSRCRANDG